MTIWTWGVALALAGLAAPPLVAQETTANVVTPAPAPAPGTIGPEQLRDFTLPGTVTRRTESPPASTTNTAITARQPEGQPSDTAPLAVRTRPVVSTAPSRSVTVSLPPADPLSQEPTLAPPVDETSNAVVAQPNLTEPAPSPAVSLPANNTGGSWTPWLLGLLLIAGAGAFLVWRQRASARPAYAGGARVEEFVGIGAAAPDAPRVAQPQPAPVPAPAPVHPRSDGIISTRLRPWLEIEFGARRAVVTDDTATVHFDVTIYNSGSATARDVRIEAHMFNAGPDQDRELGAFFEHPAAAKVAPIPEIAPLTRVELKSAVAMSRAELREYEVEGRKLFVPILGFNAHYRYGNSNGQTSASFIVGRGGDDGSKMAPIRLDLGPRIFRGLSQRQHSVGVRA